MSDLLLNKKLSIILLLIQSDYPCHVDVVEDFNVFVWVLTIFVLSISVLNRPHESYKLAWDDPVEVTVFDSLVVLILLDIEGSEVIPTESDGILETLKHMEKSAVVEAVSLRGISVMLEERVVWLELLVSLVSRHLEDDDHEGSHEESSIDHFVPRVVR